MKRRDVIAGFILSAFARSAVAQHSTGMKRIAMVDPALKVEDMKIGGDSGSTIVLQELQRLGYVEGQNLIIQRYSAEGRIERYAALAREIVSTQPDLIATQGTLLTRAFKAATDAIPIVTTTGDPIRQGLVLSIARPGGNVTGVSVDAGFELWGKRLEVLVEAVPKARTVLFVSTEGAWERSPGAKATRETAQKLGISLISAPVSTPVNEKAFRRTFETITRGQADGIVFSLESESYAYRQLMVELVQRVGIPAVYLFREQVEAGGLMSYSNDAKEAARMFAKQVAEVLRGGKPSETPYVQATRYELVINLKTAKALGLEMPPALLARADEVIE